MIKRPGSQLSVLFEVHAAAQAVAGLVGEALRDAPLTPAEYAHYSVLYDEGPSTPTELARRSGLALTSMMHVVRALLAKGHAERLPDPTDGRSYRLALTPDGYAAHAAASAAFGLAERRFSRALRLPQAQAREVLQAVGTAARSAQEAVAAARTA
jgi:DNA-binding MarR family transcriptional regulator